MRNKKVVLSVFLIVFFVVALLIGDHYLHSPKSPDYQVDAGSSGPCIQVVTKAKNLKTGEIKDFGTPCDVPSGWQAIN